VAYSINDNTGYNIIVENKKGLQVLLVIYHFTVLLELDILQFSWSHLYVINKLATSK